MFCRHIPFRTEKALSLIRIMLGIIFIAHGAQKVLGLFGGPGLDGWVQSAAGLGITPILAYLAAFFELIGGFLLLSGIASEIGALMLIPIMIAAIWLVHGKNGFFAQKGGYEYQLLLLVSLIAIVIGGPGKWYAWCACKLTGCDCKKGR